MPSYRESSLAPPPPLSPGRSSSHHQQSPVLSLADRYDPLSLAALEQSRRLSLKAQEPSKASLRGGDLTLPSRTPSSPTATTPNYIEPADLPTISSTTFLQVPSRDTHVPQFEYNRPYVSAKEIVLAVIGTSGCGKSTLIREGLSRYGLGEPMVMPETSNSDPYIRRTGTVWLDDQLSSIGTPGILEVIEVDIQSSSSGLLKWPRSLPSVDGIIICYDTSNQSSSQPVEGLLKDYRNVVVPIMVLGCKSESPHEIDPIQVMAMLKRYDTGLIEVSSANEAGKARMKKSFMYLLKAILRQRGDNPILDNRNPASPDFLK